MYAHPNQFLLKRDGSYEVSVIKYCSRRMATVNALINAPLKNNYDPQRRLVWREKNYFGPLGAPYLERRLRIRAQLTPFREVERAEYGYTDNDRLS